jgi:two-component sensor histidine kinase
MSDAIKRSFADSASASSGAAVAEVCELCFEARLLLREFSHRINNEFASAIGVIADAARSTSDEAKVTLAAVMDQLQNYALVQHALQIPEYSSCIDAAAYLRELCRAISRSKLGSKGIELRLVVRSFGMNSERCWLLGLIVSELITNAERHAFSISGGLISVNCCRRCRSSNAGSRTTAWAKQIPIPGEDSRSLKRLQRASAARSTNALDRTAQQRS